MKTKLSSLLMSAIILYACNKPASDGSSVSLTASSTQATVGQTITVTANTIANSLSWTVTPVTATSKVYTVSTEKTNYISFSQPGIYTVGVRARSLKLDSIHVCNHADSIGHHVPDSIWNRHIENLWINNGYHSGGCKNGIDSASVSITVK